MKTIKKRYIFKAPVGAVWGALVDPKIIGKWGGGPAKITDQANTKFTLWSGEIYGINTKVIKNKELDQDWYSEGWKEPSKVIFKFSNKRKETVLELVQKNVPEKEIEEINSGWDEYYFEPMKRYLEKCLVA